LSQKFSRELFEEQLEVGAKHEKIVCKAFNDAGIPAELQVWETEVEKIVTGVKDDYDASYTKYQKDIIIPLKSGEPFIIEVKSRNLEFSNDPWSFPFRDAVLETVWGWDQKAIKPRAIVFISQLTHAMLVVNVNESFQHWTQRSIWDSLRQISSYEYFIPSEYLRKFSELVEWLKANV